MSRDPISIATSEILRPLLASQGFLRLTNRFTARVVDSIVQFVSVRVSARGTHSFKLEYASISLFPPRDTLPLQPGGTVYIEQESNFFWDRLFHRKFHRTAFPGLTEDEARASMSRLCSQLEAQAFHFFAQTESIEKLCSFLKKERWGSEHHRHFEIGCCLATLRDFEEAKKELILAKKLYVKSGCDRCDEKVQQAQALLDAIENKNSNTLIDGWITKSITTLNLEPLVKRG
jgi:hypothetical protein